MTPSLETESQGLKKSISTANVHKTSSHTQDLLGLFSTDINFDGPPAGQGQGLPFGGGHNTSDVSGEVTGVPGAESTR